LTLVGGIAFYHRRTAVGRLPINRAEPLVPTAIRQMCCRVQYRHRVRAGVADEQDRQQQYQTGGECDELSAHGGLTPCCFNSGQRCAECAEFPSPPLPGWFVAPATPDAVRGAACAAACNARTVATSFRGRLDLLSEYWLHPAAHQRSALECRQDHDPC